MVTTIVFFYDASFKYDSEEMSEMFENADFSNIKYLNHEL